MQKHFKVIGRQSKKVVKNNNDSAIRNKEKNRDMALACVSQIMSFRLSTREQASL